MPTRVRISNPRVALLGAIAGLLAIVVGDAMAAVAQRTFVASHGDDANACTLVAPCRSFAAALARTNAGGEVIVLDSAGYGPVTIAQSVSIVAPAGVYAGISVFAGNGVTITTPGVAVTLRGLAINGQGGGTGIYFQDGATLAVERCTVAGMSFFGIVLAAGQTFVHDTVVRDGGGPGVLVVGNAVATFDRMTVEHNALSGFFVGANARASIADSTIAGNGRAGVQVSTSTISDIPEVSVSRSRIADNDGSGGYGGIHAVPGASGGHLKVTATGNDIRGHTYGILAGGGSPTGSVDVNAVGNSISRYTDDGLRVDGSNAYFTASQNFVDAPRVFGHGTMFNPYSASNFVSWGDNRFAGTVAGLLQTISPH